MLKQLLATATGLTMLLFLAGSAQAGKDRSGTDPAFALSDLSRGSKPSVFLRTNEVVYLLNEPITLTLDAADNGHLASKTQFLYQQNMETGEIRYINTTSGLLPPGQITDLSGNASNFEALPLPNVTNQVLYGSGGIVGGTLTAGEVGNYQFVLEFRDATGQRVFFRANWMYTVVESVVTLGSEITSDTTLTSNNAYLLDGQATFVRSGATLTIEPGTYILGANVGTLVVERGGRIIADGTAARPIVMTSAQPVGSRARADWGGLILNGNAPVNIPGGEGLGEGDTGAFGGDDPNDSSGILRYVRVEFAGFEFSPDNELNGIAFQGVGAGTVVEYIQVHFNKDDGVEFFGGTCNMKYVVLTGIGDDSLDWTDGWTGKAQFIVAQQRGDDADNGIEADNSAENNDLEPRSAPAIYNATFIGAPTLSEGEESDIGLLIREGTAGQFFNFIVTGYKEVGIEIDHGATFVQAQNGALVLNNSIIHDNGSNPDFAGRGNFSQDTDESPAVTTETFVTQTMDRNREADPELRDPFNVVSPDFRPSLEAAARNLNFVKIPPDDGFFDTTVTFVGGVDPLNDWTRGWTTSAPH